MELNKKINNQPFTGAFHPQSIPDIDVKIVVAGHKEPAGLAERHRSDATNDVVVRILGQFLVCPDIIQFHRGVIRARTERRPLREELEPKKAKLVG